MNSVPKVADIGHQICFRCKRESQEGERHWPQPYPLDEKRPMCPECKPIFEAMFLENLKEEMTRILAERS
jgi:hypothetical protein